MVTAKKLALIGEPPADHNKKRPKAPKPAAESKQVQDTATNEEPEIDLKKIIGRDVDVGNTP